MPAASTRDLVLSLSLLAGIGVVADALADDLVRVRRCEVRAADEAAWHGELLQAARDLPRAGLEESARSASATLRRLGFDGAGVALVGQDHRLQLYLDAIPARSGSQHRDEGVLGRAIRENRTVVVSDYSADPDRLNDRTKVGSGVVVPIRIAGEPVGAIMGGRRRTGDPTPAEVEVVDVIAAQLGIVLDIDAQVANLRELLERRLRLDGMRSSFVTEVSDELRHPLTVVRGIGETLMEHHDELDLARWDDLVRRMTEQADRLRATIDALLDFSGDQTARVAPQVQMVSLADLLEGFTGALTVGDEAPDEVEIVVDVALVRHGLELLAGRVNAVRSGRVRAAVGADHVVVHVDPYAAAPALPDISATLAHRLLVLGGATIEPADGVVHLPRAATGTSAQPAPEAEVGP